MDKSETTSDREAAFVALLTEIQFPLALYVRSLLPGDSTAADVAQQANAVVWKKREDYQPGTNFKAWVFSIARFEVLNYRKQQAQSATLVFSEDLEVLMAEELQENAPPLDARSEALAQCLKSLRKQERDLVLHRYGSKNTLNEFATQVGRSVGGLKVTLHRIRNRLLDCIDRKLAADGSIV